MIVVLSCCCRRDGSLLESGHVLDVVGKTKVRFFLHLCEILWIRTPDEPLLSTTPKCEKSE